MSDDLEILNNASFQYAMRTRPLKKYSPLFKRSGAVPIHPQSVGVPSIEMLKSALYMCNVRKAIEQGKISAQEAQAIEDG